MILSSLMIVIFWQFAMPQCQIWIIFQKENSKPWWWRWWLWWKGSRELNSKIFLFSDLYVYINCDGKDHWDNLTKNVLRSSHLRKFFYAKLSFFSFSRKLFPPNLSQKPAFLKVLVKNFAFFSSLQIWSKMTSGRIEFD